MGTNNPKLSIIIVSYNSGGLTKKCINSIKKNTKDLTFPNCQIILVDNASLDKSLAEFEPTGNIELIKNKENVGFSRAVNQGIKEAKGEYILLLNPDTVIIDGAITKLIDFAQNTGDAGVIVPKLLNSNGSIQDSLMYFPTIWRAIQEFWFGRPVYSKYFSNSKKPIQVEAGVMATFLITPDALEKVGLLNEKYFMYFEDLDYCKRVCNSGLKVYYVPDAEVIHQQGVSGKTLALPSDQWRRLIPSSKIYNGLFGHFLINTIIRIGQKIRG